MTGQSATITQAGEVRSSRIESMRALAALGVVIGHIYGQSRNYDPGRTLDSFVHRTLFGGGFGVFVFFGLTGYLLFWPFARQGFGGGPPIDLKRYAINRILRILPLYYAVVVILMIVQEGGGSGGQWLHFLTFTQSFSDHYIGTVDGPMWSLVVEVLFYILLPFLAYGLAWVVRGRKLGAAALLIALGVASYFVRQHAVADGARRLILEYSLPATFMYFVPGMLVALLRLHWEERPPAWLRGPLAVGDWWLVAAALLTIWQFDSYNRAYLIAAATFLALGACVLPVSRGRLVRALDWRPLAVIGVASYSLYLWHDPIVVRLATLHHIPHGFVPQLVIAGGISIVVALVSYRLIEAPFLALRRQWSSARATVADAPVAAAEASLPAPAPTSHPA
jgi:peptidoglycan/LPS O-acetylase OafA/YrhL